MTESIKAKKKALELEEQELRTKKAELDLRSEELRYKINKQDFDYSYATSQDSTGVFYFTNRVDTQTCAVLGAKIRKFAQLNEGAPVTLIINSPGGEVIAGLGLYDELRTIAEQGHHITTKVRGYAASFGAILLQAGDTRLMGAESHLMIHEISSLSIGKLHEQENELEFTKRLNLRLFNIMAERTNGKWTGPNLYRKAKAKDWWMDATEALKEGLCDGVG